MKRKHPEAMCEECPLYDKGTFVPTEFAREEASPRIAFVGEAPGANEARVGRPFVGSSGKLLEAVLREHGISRLSASVTNAVACRPPGNATPSNAAQRACRPRLWADLRQAAPDYVVALGAVATSVLLDRKSKITSERVGPPKSIDGEPWKLIPTFHPAACLRNPGAFPSLVEDVGKVRTTARIKWEPPTYKAFDNHTQASIALQQLLNERGYDPVALDLEVGEDKDESFDHPERITAAGICYKPGYVAVIGENAMRSLGVRRLFGELVKSKRTIWQNGKYDLGVLHRLGIASTGLWADTMLMSYCLDERSGTHGLGYLGQEMLGTPDWKKEFHEAGGFGHAPPEALYKYNATDAHVTYQLYEHMIDRMDANDKKLHEFLVWASNGLMYVEAEGIKLDADLLTSMGEQMEKELDALGTNMREFVEDLSIDDPELERLSADKGFNPNSVPQTRAVLTHLFGYPIDTTDADTLQWFAQYEASANLREFSRMMLEWRSISKLYGTYVKGWMRRMDKYHRIHPTFLLHGTTTGRLSCRNPNVQNPPRQGFRDAIIADEGNVLIYADYSNIEGRIVCTLAQSESMREAFGIGRDIHSEVARSFYGPGFTKEQRVLAKSVVHGTNYGRTPEGIAEGLGVSVSEARKVDNTYHKMFPEVRKWQSTIKKLVLTTEDELITPWGRKRRFGLITRDNQEDIYKEALAFMPQSIASDICLTAGIRLREKGVHVRLLIHDGILVECSRRDADSVARLMEVTMVNAGREYTDYVPFPVEVAIGVRWGQL